MPKTAELFFDVGSPYSYLAVTQVASFVARGGGEIVWKPMVLGAVFKAAGNVMPAASPAKASYMLADLARWAAAYGVPFRMTSRFPVNALRAGRLVVAAEATGKVPELVRALFDALWVDDRDVTADAELAAIATSVGLDGAALVLAIDTPAVKDRLRAYTDEAVRRGAFGAPTVFVGDEMFFGNDRLDFVERALRDAR